MSNPQQDEPLESDAVFGDSVNEETLIPPDPLPKSDSETLIPARPVPDPDEISPGEEEEDEEDGEEIDEETPAISSAANLHTEPPTADPNVSAPDVTLASPTNRRGGFRRKKSFKGKGKGKSSAKKLQAIEEDLKTLRLNLNPIRFMPLKLLDFRQHEKLLRKLGLWEFVQIDFDRTIRADFIAQLVANYNSKNRASYVNGCRVRVNRADLARALKLPLKKEKVNAAAAEVDLESEVFSEDSIGFVIGFMSDWVLLHEDMWWMPNEVADWMKLIKEGHPEKVDWAGLIWFMVEKEVKQGGKLRDCYYASHLQHLIKCQREDLFLIEEPLKDEVEIVEKDMEDGDNEEKAKESDAVEMTVEAREENSVVEGPSTELTLGQDSEKEEGVQEGVKDEGVKEEGVKDLEMVDAEKCRDSDEEGGEEEQEHEHEHEHEQEQWLFNGKNKMGEHFMQPCSAENDHEFVRFEDKKDQEEEMDEEENGEGDEEVERNDYNVFPNDDGLEGDGFTGNFLQGMEGNQMAFTSEEHIHNPSSVDHARADVQQHIAPQPSFFNNSGKRVIDYDYDTVNDPNKRLRINETWDNKHSDFGMLMEQMEQIGHRARVLYEEKEQAMEQSSINQQILLSELQKREAMIEHLHKARLEETQKKDFTIRRLERELFLMESVLDGYKKAFKETKKAFAEYREKAHLPEESLYKDAGPGGLMLTAAEIERRRVKREEEFKMNCLTMEQRMREVEEGYVGQFDEYVDKINLMDKRLIGLEADAKEVIALHLKRKTQPAEESQETVPEVAETQPPMEEEPEVAETQPPMEEEPEVQAPEAVPVPVPEPEAVPVPVPEPEVQGSEAVPVPVPEPEVQGSEAVPVPVPVPEPEVQGSEAVPVPEPEVQGSEAVPVPVPEPEVQVPEAADHQPSPVTDEKVVEEVMEPLPDE